MPIVPLWLLKFVLNFIVGAIFRKVGGPEAEAHILLTVQKHTTALAPESNPPLSARHDPNQSLPPDRGGRPR